MSQAALSIAVPTGQPTRSASELELRVTNALRRSGHRLLHETDCTCLNDTVILTGVVPSFHMKQVAQETARTVDGVRRIDNRLEVILAVNALDNS